MAYLTLSFLLCFASLPFISDAGPIISEPRAFESFTVSYIQNEESCPYTLIILTSCFSPEFTRDQISIAFGDAYGNQIYVPRLDDPTTQAFEKCSSDTFQVTGPCTHQICYVYLYRTGFDGWIPETIKIYSEGSKAVKFDFNTSVPDNTWYGFNYCNGTSPPPPSGSNRWASGLGGMVLVVLGSVVAFMLV